MAKLVVIGMGVVGSALAKALELNGHEVIPYDPPANILCKPHTLLNSDAFFICVPTPNNTNGINLEYIRESFDYIQNINKSSTVIIRSTILPGTTECFQKQYPHFKVLHSPEFLTESTSVYDEIHPKRQIIGYTDKSQGIAGKVLSWLPKAPWACTIPSKDAEMVKYFSNSFYAIKVAYANQIYDLCQKLDINYENVRLCAEHDHMIGYNHLDVFHGGNRGFGGKCLPKDTKALLNSDKDNLLSILIQAVTYNNKLTK